MVTLFEGAWLKFGVDLDEPRMGVAGQYDCPRQHKAHGHLLIDRASEIFRCHGCGIRGRGLADVMKWSGALRVPVFRIQEEGLPNERLGQCPDRRVVIRMKDGLLRVDHVGCNLKACVVCGSLLWLLQVGHFLPLLEAQPVFYVELPTSTWDRLRKQIMRGGANYLRLGKPGGGLMIFTTLPGEEPVPEVPTMLSLTLQLAVGSGLHVTSTRAWAMTHSGRQAGLPHDDASYGPGSADDGWIVLRKTRPLDDLFETVKELGYLPQGYEDVAATTAFDIPRTHTKGFWDFITATGLLLPDGYCGRSLTVESLLRTSQATNVRLEPHTSISSEPAC